MSASKKNKRHAVNVGDLIRVVSPMNHAYGTVGVVTLILDKKRVVVEAVAPGDDDYRGMEFIAYTAKPTGNTANGSPNHYYRPYIGGVLTARVNKPKPKKVKPVIPPVVVETQEQLIEHLSSPTARPVLIQIPAASTDQTEEVAQ